MQVLSRGLEREATAISKKSTKHKQRGILVSRQLNKTRIGEMSMHKACILT